MPKVTKVITFSCFHQCSTLNRLRVVVFDLIKIQMINELQQPALKEPNLNNPRRSRGYAATHPVTALKELNMKVMGNISHRS